MEFRSIRELLVRSVIPRVLRVGYPDLWQVFTRPTDIAREKLVMIGQGFSCIQQLLASAFHPWYDDVPEQNIVGSERLTSRLLCAFVQEYCSLFEIFTSVEGLAL